MTFFFTEPFKRDYGALSEKIQRALDKALQFLLTNARHPSLRAKKLPGTGIWYGRVSRDYRFTFQFENDVVMLRRAGTHAILAAERRRKQ